MRQLVGAVCSAQLEEGLHSEILKRPKSISTLRHAFSIIWRLYPYLLEFERKLRPRNKQTGGGVRDNEVNANYLNKCI